MPRDPARFRCIAEWGIHAAEALEYAHSMGVVHRDVKPGNLMVDGTGKLWITDFGLARFGTDAGLTMTGDVLGTLRYMSPEQALAKHGLVDHRTDVYSLGATLYEVLTHQPAVNGADKQEILKKIAFDEPVALRKLDKSIPAELETITLKCLAKEPGERYATAKQLGDDLKHWLEDRPIKARPPGVRERAAKWILRHQTLARMSFAMLVLAVSGLAISTWLIWKEKEAVRLAKVDVETQRDRAAKARDRTFEALDAMTSRLAGALLESQPVISAEQRKFLTNVLSYYQEFAAEQAEDEQSRYRIGGAAFRVGHIHFRLEERDAAAKAWGQARDAFERLASEYPEEPDYRISLALSHGNLGQLLSDVGKSLEAETHHRNSQAILEKLSADFPDVPKYRFNLAKSHGRLGQLLTTLGKAPEAEAYFLNAFAILEKLAADFPKVPEYCHTLGLNQVNFGGLLRDLGKRPAAEAAYRQALEILERLVAEHPAAPEFRLNLAKGYNHLGILLRELDKRSEAETAYEQYLAHMEKLVAMVPGVPDYRHNLAGAYGNLGNLLHQSDKRMEAEAAYRRCLAHREKLAADFPSVPKYRQNLALIHTVLGEVLVELGKSAEAEVAFRKGLAIREKLAGEFSAVPQYRQEFAVSQLKLGELLPVLGKASEAEAACRQSLALMDKLVADFPNAPDCRRGLAESYTGLGQLLFQFGRRPEAETAFRQALALDEKLTADFPEIPQYTIALAGSQVNRGILLQHEGGHEVEALEWYDRAIALLKSLLETQPSVAHGRKFLRNAHWGRAGVLDRLERYGDALKDWDRAIALSSPHEQPQLRASRATSKIGAGMAAEAVAEVAELMKGTNWHLDQWYDFACIYAIASNKIADKKQVYGDQAIKLLQKAVTAGYKDAAHIKKDKDLDALRDREDFKKLVADLDAKMKP